MAPLRGSRALVAVGLAAALSLLPRPARAVRFGLGVASEATPLVIDRVQTGESRSNFRLGFRPVLEVEPSYWISFGAYAPFTVLRTGDGGTSAQGAESVFGLSASGRVPFLSDRPPEEILAYATVRGGFGTFNGRAGPFTGVALGASVCWLSTGRGFFAEVGGSRTRIARVPIAEVERNLDRYALTITAGVIFHLGGEDWRLGAKPLPGYGADGATGGGAGDEAGRPR